MPPKRKRIRPSIVIAYLLTWLAIPHVLLARKRPTATLAWVWGIIAVPFAGPIAYFMFGADRMQRKRLRKAARLGMLRHRSSKLVKEKVEELPPAESELVRVLT